MRNIPKHGAPLWVIGNPISHTLSPPIQNAGFQAANLPYRYFALEVDAAELPEFLALLEQLDSPGANITLPHKQNICELIQNKTSNVSRLQAANTIYRKNGELWLENTDVHGFQKLIEPWHQRVRQETTLLLGAGGAARACLAGLQELGARKVLLWNRTRKKALDLQQEFSELEVRVLTDEQLNRGALDVQLAINSTSLGLEPDDNSPIPPEQIKPDMVGVDLIYNRETKFIQSFKKRGKSARGGLRMLVHQAARAWKLWMGQSPPVEAMTEAARQSLDA